jgi:hypothetical protein
MAKCNHHDHDYRTHVWRSIRIEALSSNELAYVGLESCSLYMIYANKLKSFRFGRFPSTINDRDFIRDPYIACGADSYAESQ